jgi:hypothetical protein
MLRNTLAATTALVLCVATAHAGRATDPPSDRILPRFTKTGAPGVAAHDLPATVLTGRRIGDAARGSTPLYGPEVTFSNLSKDKNAEYISWYAYTMFNSEYSYYQSSHFHYKEVRFAFNAAPFTGAGKKVDKIGAPIYATDPGSVFDLEIYSATASGFPRGEIAGGSAGANDGGLTWVNVNIFLNAGQEYFFAVRCWVNRIPCAGGWDLEDANFTGSAHDYEYAHQYETYNFGTGTYTYSGSTSWISLNAIPASGAFVIK